MLDLRRPKLSIGRVTRGTRVKVTVRPEGTAARPYPASRTIVARRG
jgi:hypothetical protein